MLEESAYRKDRIYRGDSSLLSSHEDDSERSRKSGDLDGDDEPGVEMEDLRRRNRSDTIMTNVSDYGKNVDDKKDEPVTGYNILVLLFILGVTTGVINGCAQWANKTISYYQAQLLLSNAAGPLFFMMSTAFLGGLSALIVKKGAIAATIGSGMPEVKSLLVSDFHHSDFPTIVSFKILCIRLFSIVTAVGSGLSIGIAAPLVHVSICTAYTLIIRVAEFGEFLENHSLRKQIFAAAAGVGMTAVFNAPVGGLLLSIELTSTFYLISNYWRSFMAACVGATMYSIFLLTNSSQGRIFQVNLLTDPFHKWELPVYFMLGGMCGVLALYYLKLHQAWFLMVKPYTIKYPIGTAAAAGAFTALLIFAVGAYSAQGVSESVIVHDVFQDCVISDMQRFPHVSRVGGLLASLMVRTLLTLIGTTLRISCGVFLPVLTIGALLGRIFGQLLQFICGPTATIYVAGYAMVGAVAFVSGTTHTISVAVIVIEQTGQFDMLLPCLIGAVIACGITKSRSLSLYDQGMVNKGLESFELLLKESGGFRYAADVMDETVTSVTRHCTVGDMFKLLENVKQSTFPVIDNAINSRLIGCLDRGDVFSFLKQACEQRDLLPYLHSTLPLDSKLDSRRLERLRQIEARQAWMNAGNLEAISLEGILGGNGLSGSGGEAGHVGGGGGYGNHGRQFHLQSLNLFSKFKSSSNVDKNTSQKQQQQKQQQIELDEHGRPVSRFKGMFGMLNSGKGSGGVADVDSDHSDYEPSGDDDIESGDAVANPIHTPPKDSSSPFTSTSPSAAGHSYAAMAHSPYASGGSAAGAGRINTSHSSGALTAPPLTAASLASSAGAVAPLTPQKGGAPPPPVVLSPFSLHAIPGASPFNSTDNLITKFFAKRTSVLPSRSSADNLDGAAQAPEVYSDAQVSALLCQSVDLTKQPLLAINGFPFTAHRQTTMDQLYVLFEMVKVHCVFVVTNSKRLEGMISKDLLMQSLKNKMR